VWREQNTLIQNAIAKNRARKGARVFQPVLTTHENFEINKAVAAAFELPDPLARDTALERLRWDVAETLQGLDPMARDVVFAYAVKLRMCLRRAAMTQEAGLALATKILDAPLPVAAEEKGTDDE
jgi:hypothetical protein